MRVQQLPIPALEQAQCIGIPSAFLEEIGVALPPPDLQTANGMSFLRFKQRSADFYTIWEGGRIYPSGPPPAFSAFPTLSNPMSP
jgi:hypothetical protein